MLAALGEAVIEDGLARGGVDRGGAQEGLAVEEGHRGAFLDGGAAGVDGGDEPDQVTGEHLGLDLDVRANVGQVGGGVLVGRVGDCQHRGLGLGARVDAAVDLALLDQGGDALRAGGVEGVVDRRNAIGADGRGADADAVRAEDDLGALRDGRGGRVTRGDDGLLSDEDAVLVQLDGDGGAGHRGDVDVDGILGAGQLLGLGLHVLDDGAEGQGGLLVRDVDGGGGGAVGHGCAADFLVALVEDDLDALGQGLAVGGADGGAQLDGDLAVVGFLDLRIRGQGHRCLDLLTRDRVDRDGGRVLRRVDASLDAQVAGGGLVGDRVAVVELRVGVLGGGDAVVDGDGDLRGAIAEVELDLTLGDGRTVVMGDVRGQGRRARARDDLEVRGRFREVRLGAAGDDSGGGQGAAGGVGGAVHRVGDVGAGQHRHGVVPVVVVGRARAGAGVAQTGDDVGGRSVRGLHVEGDLRETPLLVPVDLQTCTRVVGEPHLSPVVVLVSAVVDGVAAVPDAGVGAVGVRVTGHVDALDDGVGVETGARSGDSQIRDLDVLRQLEVVLHATGVLVAGGHLARLELHGEGVARIHFLRVFHDYVVGGQRQEGAVGGDAAVLDALLIDGFGLGDRGRQGVIAARQGDQPEGQRRDCGGCHGQSESLEFHFHVPCLGMGGVSSRRPRTRCRTGHHRWRRWPGPPFPRRAAPAATE